MHMDHSLGGPVDAFLQESAASGERPGQGRRSPVRAFHHAACAYPPSRPSWGSAVAGSGRPPPKASSASRWSWCYGRSSHGGAAKKMRRWPWWEPDELLNRSNRRLLRGSKFALGPLLVEHDAALRDRRPIELEVLMLLEKRWLAAPGRSARVLALRTLAEAA
jgi:hypothetical protein